MTGISQREMIWHPGCQFRSGGDHWGLVSFHYPPLPLTVHVPLDAPGGKLQGLVDLLQHSLQLLLLGDLRLGNLCHVELLTLQFLWRGKGKSSRYLGSPET